MFIAPGRKPEGGGGGAAEDGVAVGGPCLNCGVSPPGLCILKTVSSTKYVIT